MINKTLFTKIKQLIPTAGILSPVVALAVDFPAPHDFGSLVDTVIRNILNPIVYLLFALATLYFMWGAVQFIQKAGDESAREEGRNRMVYGVIGLFVILSVWGLVNLVAGTFNLENNTRPTPPSLTYLSSNVV